MVPKEYRKGYCPDCSDICDCSEHPDVFRVVAVAVVYYMMYYMMYYVVNVSGAAACMRKRW